MPSDLKSEVPWQLSRREGRQGVKGYENPFLAEDQKIFEVLRRDGIGAKMRLAMNHLAMREGLAIYEYCRKLFYMFDSMFTGHISLDLFQTQVIPRLRGAFQQFAISPQDEESMIRLLDYDGIGKVLWGEFLNYFTIEDAPVQVVFMKLRIELKLFLLNREHYGFFRAYQELSLFSTYSPLSMETFEYMMVRKLGVSTLTREQLLLLFNHLRKEKETLLFPEFLAFLQSQTSDILGDEKPCLVDLRFSSSGGQEQSLREAGFAIVKKDGLEQGTELERRRTFRNVRKKLWYLVKPCSFYPSRAEFLKNRITDIDLSRNDKSQLLIEKNFYPLKHGGKAVRSPNEVYIYVKRDPMSESPLISVELQQKTEFMERLKKLDFELVGSEAIGLSFHGEAVSLYACKYRIDLEISQIMRAIIPTDVMLRLSRSMLDLIRSTMIQRQMRFLSCIEPFLKDKHIDTAGFCEFVQSFHQRKEERECKLVFNTIKSKSVTSIAVEDFQRLICWTPECIEKSLSNYADHMYNHPEEYNTLITCLDESDADRSGTIPLGTFHKIIASNKCAILIEELEEWFKSTTLVENGLVDYPEYFRMWWNDDEAFHQDNLALFIQNRNEEGFVLEEVVGLQSVNRAVSKMRKLWREQALQLGAAKYLDIEQTYLSIGVNSIDEEIPMSILKVLPRRPPFNLNVRAMDLKMLLIQLTSGKGESRALTFPRFASFLLYGDGGLDAVVRKLQMAVQFSQREYQMNIPDFYYHLDENNDGLISRDEIQTGFKQLSQDHSELTSMEMALLLTKYDVLHRDLMTVDDFLSLVLPKSEQAPFSGSAPPLIHNIEEDDLAFDGSLTVHIQKASGVLLKGYGNFQPYVKVQFRSYRDPIYMGRTKPSRNVSELETRYCILWETADDALVRLRYPGEDLQHPLALDFSLFDVDRFQDILIGSCSVEGKSLQRLLLRGDAVTELELRDESSVPVGFLSVNLGFTPSRYEESDMSFAKPREDSLLDYPGNLYVTVMKAKGVDALSAKVRCTLLPEGKTFSTFSAEQPAPRTVIVFMRDHSSTLKIPFLSSDRVQNSLKFEVVQQRKVLDDIVLGTKVVEAIQLSSYIENSMTVWIPLLDAFGSIGCRIQVVFQFILLEVDSAHPLSEIAREIEGVAPRSLEDLRVHVQSRLPPNASEEVFVSMKNGDPTHSQVLNCTRVFAALTSSSIAMTAEFKSTVIHLFDPKLTGFINYYLLCSKVLPNEYLHHALAGFKRIMIEEFNRGKDFRRAFSSIGFEELIPLDPFLTVMKTMENQDISVDYLTLLYYTFTKGLSNSLHYSDFFGFLQEADENASAAIKQVGSQFTKALLADDSSRRCLQLFYKYDFSGAGFVSSQSLFSILRELGIQLPEKSMQLFFGKFCSDERFLYESVIQVLSPQYFGKQEMLIDKILSTLRKWTADNKYFYFSLVERMRSVSSVDLSKGISRRSLRIFLTNINAPLEEEEWKPLFDSYSPPELAPNVDFDRCFRDICSQPRQSEVESLDQEIRQKIRRAVGNKGLTFNFADRFRLRDPQLSRSISVSEFRSLLDVEKIALTESECSRMLTLLDPNVSGSICYHDFLDFFALSKDDIQQLFSVIQSAVDRYPGNALELFRRFDVRQNNTVRVVDFKACLKRLDVVLSEFDFNSLVQQFGVPRNPFLVFYASFLSQFSRSTVPVFTQPNGEPLDASVYDDDHTVPSQIPLYDRPNPRAASIVPSRRTETAAPFRLHKDKEPIFGLPQKVVDELMLRRSQISEGAAALEASDSLQFEDRALVFRTSGLFTCPICEFKQNRKYLNYCDMCGASNPFAFVPSNLVPCPSCCYRNPPTLKRCELCKAVLAVPGLPADGEASKADPPSSDAPRNESSPAVEQAPKVSGK